MTKKPDDNEEGPLSAIAREATDPARRWAFPDPQRRGLDLLTVRGALLVLVSDRKWIFVQKFDGPAGDRCVIVAIEGWSPELHRTAHRIAAHACTKPLTGQFARMSMTLRDSGNTILQMWVSDDAVVPDDAAYESALQGIFREIMTATQEVIEETGLRHTYYVVLD